jgi:hypothetical protein
LRNVKRRKEGREKDKTRERIIGEKKGKWTNRSLSELGFGQNVRGK